MLKENFADILPMIAVGLVGAGSECFGYDDEISTDHDFEPGFCIFVPEEKMDRRRLFELERAYAKLPNEYKGYKRQKVLPVGGNRHGVIDISRFYEEHAGSKNGFHSLQDWFLTPETFLAEATNGEVFFDNYGEFSKIRENLLNMPSDVRLKKLAGHILLMGQSGQYNYPRCLSHGETGASQLAIFEFVKHTIEVAFLINRKYSPYYKWSFRALRRLDVLFDMADKLEFLISTDNEEEMSLKKCEIIEKISCEVIKELGKEISLPDFDNELERYAYYINDKISDSNIRNLNILYAIN
jgi:hypothetical protein